MSNDPDPYRGAFSQEPNPAPPPQANPEIPPAPPRPPRPPVPPPTAEESTGIVEPVGWQDGYRAAPPYSDQNPYPPRHYPPPGNYPPPPRPQYRPSSTPGALVPARRSVNDDADHPALDMTDVRGMSVPAKHGWRAVLNTLPGISIGPGKDERDEIGLKERVVRPVRTTFTVGVLNLKGGVGKTSVTKSLGSVMCSERGDQVIAVDLDNDSGNLTDRHGRETPLSILDLVADSSVSRYHDVRHHTSMDKVSKLEVLGQPEFARTDRVVERDDFHTTMGLLGEYYSVVLLDCGTALKTELMQAVLLESQALVVVTNASTDSLRETDQTLQWLRNNGYQKLMENVVLVINHTEAGRPNVVVPKVVEQFSRVIPNPKKRIFITPFDKHIHEGREINLDLLSKTSRRRYLEIAAALSDLFPRSAG
ncbi:MinD/ParA family ATP-binding protein [Candidatus Mycobacterium methanotrophicum]|uniref:MinD/ParA family protein n=1 Tax=Candidatus Mycobacterium methanotrophicum TaxID=2943498 RepID=A0ABY4QTK9_9MYCO|nr:MinD/ParA family protein [Candidatus Mycobacterium methanotrophicum]UQX13425.1 MinD/ParA family protein [Candidatus Mycobacterium methanotrophicum]